MKVQVIWENGVFRPTLPLALKHPVITIQIPDEEVIAQRTEAIPPARPLPPEAEAYARALEERLDRIRHAPLPDDADLQPLTQKQRERLRIHHMSPLTPIPIIYEGMVLEDAFRADLHCVAPLRLCARNP